MRTKALVTYRKLNNHIVFSDSKWGLDVNRILAYRLTDYLETEDIRYIWGDLDERGKVLMVKADKPWAALLYMTEAWRHVSHSANAKLHMPTFTEPYSYSIIEYEPHIIKALCVLNPL